MTTIPSVCCRCSRRLLLATAVRWSSSSTAQLRPTRPAKASTNGSRSPSSSAAGRRSIAPAAPRAVRGAPPPSESGLGYPSPRVAGETAAALATTPASSARTCVFSWGSGAFGGLGCSSYRPHATPQLVPSLSSLPSPVLSVSSGWTSNVALTARGEAFLWGYKPFLRSLSLTAKLHNRVPALLTAVQSLNLGRLTLSNAVTTPAPLRPFSADVPAVAASCGGDFAAVVDGSGRLWTFGSGFFGQLGHSPKLSDTFLREPRAVDALVNAGVRVRSVACGFNHMLALADDGRVYVCGKHDHGALGIGKVLTEGKRLFYPHLVPTTSPSPTALLSLDPRDTTGKTVASLESGAQYIGEVVQVSAGMKHSLLLTRDGKAFASGHNQFGQCGFSPLDVRSAASSSASAPSSATTFLSLSTFTRVSALKHEHVVSLSAGQHHSLFLTSSGRVLACGLNQQSQCGQPAAMSTLRQSSALSAYTQRHFECVAEPREVELDDGFDCVRVVAGFYDSALIARDGRVRWWGGRMKQEGQRGRVDDVMAGRRVRDVSFGLVHSLLLTDDDGLPATQPQAASQPTTASTVTPPSHQNPSDPRPSWY